ncbi:MAG: hypothetical protein NXY57DRAFT_1045003, partial [Lentinula lateritia]
GGTVAPSQNQNQNDNIQHEVMSLREELAQLRAEQARNNRHPPTPPPRYNRYQDRTPYPSHYDRPLRRNRPYENDNRDQGYDNDCRLHERDNRDRLHDRERDNRDRLHDRERDRSYNRYERHSQDQHREPRSNNSSSQANQLTHNNRPAPLTDQSLSASTHAPTVPTTTANLQLPNPPPVHTITTAISPHESSIDNQFEDLLYVTQDEKIAAASLLLYGPSDDLHEDCMWDSSTGACVLVGNSLRQIQERNGPIVLPPPNPDMGNPIMDANPDSAVAAAEARMGEAHQPGNFNALWVAREMAWQAQRTLHQEQDLGILCECSTLPALLAAHLQIFNEQKIDWVDKPIITLEGEPWNTEQDRAKPEVPSFPTPDLNESTEIWALWCIVHANIRDHPGITWTHSGFVDLATVQMHLILHRLIR